MDNEIADRRKPDAQVEKLTEILQSITVLHLKFNEVHPTIEGMRMELSEHIKDENHKFASAFPNDDPEGHRAAHEAMIRKAEAEAREAEDRAAIVLAAKKKAAEMTVYGVLIALLALFIYFWNGHMPPSAHIPMPKL